DLRADGLTRCVLGLRDVLDDPATVRREWNEAANEEAVRDYYDAVWVYGDPRVYDPVREYRFSSEMAAKVTYSGYLAKVPPRYLEEIEEATLLSSAGDAPDRLALCLLGGGQDGAQVAETFAGTEFPAGMTGVIIAGPFLPADVQLRLRQQAKDNPRLRVLPFVTDSELLLSRAERVVAMGGYNTICEVLSFKKPALIVPRVQPRREQLIRARRLQQMGLLDVLAPEDLTARRVIEWLALNRISSEGALSRVEQRIDLNGLANLPRLLERVLESPPCPTRGRHLGRRNQYVVI